MNQALGSPERPLRVAVIGAGASGFYATEALLKAKEVCVQVDLFNRLPAPYGLVRYGVAPDHQKIKSVTRLFIRTALNAQVRYFGNVLFGRDFTLDDARRFYDAVIFATGATSDRQLGIKGEELEGSLSATEFVYWYNAHPQYCELNPDVDTHGVAVIGMGNVAVDVCRVLIKDCDALEESDIADYALKALRQSKITDVYMIGRRGPAQTKFTTKELRELTELEGVDLILDPEALKLDPISEAALADDLNARKNVEILQEIAARGPQGHAKRLHLRFLESPISIEGDTRVTGITLEKNRLEDDNGYLNAVGTGAQTTLDVGMVLRSVGYKGEALASVPFNARRGIIPNQEGRVTNDEGAVIPGLYAAGWIKRGPTGVIGTNKPDAVATVNALISDLPNLEAAQEDLREVPQLLHERGIDFVTFEQWQALDEKEVLAGKAAGKPRVKFVTVDEMLAECQEVVVS